MRRELNEIEYFNWCFGQPYNMVVVVRIRGTLRADRLREALDKAQRRHPLLGPGDPSDVVLTVQHVVGDGMSLLFLVRDLLGFLEDPDAPVVVLDAPASADDLLPGWVRRRIPTSSLRFRVVLFFARIWARLWYRDPPAPPRRLIQHHRRWTLSPDQTERLRTRCRREGVSVQSAVCTAFLPEFPAINTPVSLRARLGRPVGESVGLFVGGAVVSLAYRPSRGFWRNAGRFHRRLRAAMRDPFWIFRLFSKVVSLEMFRELGPLMVRMTAPDRPLGVTNLGVLDGNGVSLGGRTLSVESFYGAANGPIEGASVLTVYTVGGSLHLHLLAIEKEGAETAVRDDAERAVRRLIEALDA